MARSKRIFNRRGDVAAVDDKFTGEEPTWKDAEDLSYEEYWQRQARAFRFYTYYLETADMRPWILEWMKDNGYNKADIDAIQKVSPAWITSTVGKLVRMLQRGMPALHPDSGAMHAKKIEAGETAPKPEPVTDFIRAELRKSISAYHQTKHTAPKEEDNKKPKKPVIPPMERLRKKVHNEVICHLDSLLDGVASVKREDTPTTMPNLDVSMLLRSGGIPARGAKFVVDWLTEHRDEFVAATDKKNEEAEAYSYLRKPQLNRIIANFDKMIEDAKAHGKTTRKPRIKRPKSAEKQIAKLKYLKEDDTYSLKSVDPIALPFSQRAYTFNTKYRQLTIYYARVADGLSVSGTTVKGFDEEKSVTMILRKPEDVLPLILAGTARKIDNLMKTLKTKPKPANGRINGNTILLKTFDKS